MGKLPSERCEPSNRAETSASLGRLPLRVLRLLNLRSSASGSIASRHRSHRHGDFVIYSIHLYRARWWMHNPADSPYGQDRVKGAVDKGHDRVPDELRSGSSCARIGAAAGELTYAGSRAMLIYRLRDEWGSSSTTAEIVSRGYASFDYHIELTEGDLVKL